MDLQNIQNQLNTEFAKSETRIIFWFLMIKILIT